MRKEIKVKDVKRGDELLLDYRHMEEEIHTVKDIQTNLPLFPQDGESISFYVECWHERFFTFPMNVEDTVTINRVLKFEK